MTEFLGTLTQPGKNSPYRNRSIEENLDLFMKMRNGEFPTGSMVLRAKIDMASPNMNLRDPVLYRIIHANHYKTGNEWCIYPMYDFAHPIQDAIKNNVENTELGSRKVEGTIHWVSASHAVTAKVNLFDKLFENEDIVKDSENSWDEKINPSSKIVLESCKIEPFILNASTEERYQFLPTWVFCFR